MRKLLIVDDESIIVDGLAELFMGIEELELEIHKAYSAIEALELIKRVKIDVVLSDICMPNMSGIELLKHVRLQWPSCKVIFLSGFNDFDYIQEAIRYGSVDYILKTEDDEVIINAVRKALEEVEKNIRNEELIRRARDNMFRALPVLQKKYLMDLLEGITVWDEGEARLQFNELQIPLEYHRPVFMMTARVDAWESGEKMIDKMRIVYGIQTVAEEYLAQYAFFTSITYDRTKLLWIMQPRTFQESKMSESDAWARLLLFVQGTLDSIQDKCKDLFNISASFAVSSEYFPWCKLDEYFYSLKLTLDKSAGMENELLLIDYDPEADGEEDAKSNSESLLRYKLKKGELLATYLESGQEQEFYSLLSGIVEKIKSSQPLSQDMTSEIYYTVAMIFLSSINKWNLANKLECSVELRDLLRMEAHSSWDAVHHYFKELAKCIFEYRKDDHLSHNNRIITFIKNYAEGNLEGDLSVAKFAEMLHFNPSYLSRMYKQTTGQSISELISEIKLDNAQRMLRQGNMKINEIALALGFETPSYFTRFFKKKTNVTPQEFRDFAK
jgi:two-component system, response regulator YesN